MNPTRLVALAAIASACTLTMAACSDNGTVATAPSTTNPAVAQADVSACAAFESAAGDALVDLAVSAKTGKISAIRAWSITKGLREATDAALRDARSDEFGSLLRVGRNKLGDADQAVSDSVDAGTIGATWPPIEADLNDHLEAIAVICEQRGLNVDLDARS